MFLLSAALGLAVVLSTTLFSSFLVTLLVSSAFHLRNSGSWFKGHNTSDSEIHSEPNSVPSQNRVPYATPATNSAFRTLFSPFKRGSWKVRILTALILHDAISRIRLPRVVRYHPIYRTLFGVKLFGRRRSSNWLVRSFSLPFAILRTPLWAARVPFKIFGWKAPLAIYLILLLLSPRLRAAARRRIVWLVIRLSAAAGSAAGVAVRSEPVTMVRDLPWKAYTATALAYGQIVHTVLAALVAFLREQLEMLEEKAQPAAPVPTVPVPPAQSQSQSEDATYEMVSPIVPSDPVPGASVEMSTLRARKVSGAPPEEE